MLMARIQADDQEALGLLFERHSRLVRHIAGRILRNGAEAEDLVQDLFLFIQRKATIFDSSKGLARSWIVQMVYSRAIERRRYLATRHFYTQKDIHDGDGACDMALRQTVESDYAAKEVFGQAGIENVMGALSESQRDTMRLFFFEGHTLREISEKLGEPLGNVRNHYYRGLDKLRKQMFRRNTGKSNGNGNRSGYERAEE